MASETRRSPPEILRLMGEREHVSDLLKPHRIPRATGGRSSYSQPRNYEALHSRAPGFRIERFAATDSIGFDGLFDIGPATPSLLARDDMRMRPK